MFIFFVSDSVEANMLYWESPAGVGFSYSTEKLKMNDELTGFDFTFLLFSSLSFLFCISFRKYYSSSGT